MVWLVTLAVGPFRPAEAQLATYRIGVIVSGGPTHEAVSGLRGGLKEFGL